MKLKDALKSFVKTKDYPLSRIYGYVRQGDGKYIIVENEAKIIKRAIEAIAKSDRDNFEKAITDLLSEFTRDNIRNRSGKKFTRSILIGLVRPIYAGLATNNIGMLVKSDLYPPIVSVDLLKKAQKTLKAAKLIK